MTIGEIVPGRRPRPPRWVVVLALAMLVFGGHLLLGGASMWRALASAPATDAAAILAALARAHPLAVRIDAAAKVALALLLLFAVAAVFSSDPRARRATLLAAWAGIVYQIGDGLFLYLVVRRHSVADVLPLTDALIVGTGLVGIAFSVLLLTFFGGRRGRVFFGPGREPRHGHGG
jgi:hypothetical protein